MATLTATLSTALQRHQAGQLAEAEQIYRDLIQQDSDYVDARNMLGALLYQQNRFADALEQFERVMQLQPSADSYNSMGVALKGLHRIQEAADYYRKALELQPDRAEIHNNLGNTLRDFGQIDDAIAAYQQALILKPNYAEAENNLGAAFKDAGQVDEAMAHYRMAIVLKPNYPEAHHNLGIALNAKGQAEEAGDYFRQAIALKSDYPEALNSLGNHLQQSGDANAALDYFRRAIALSPTYPEAHHGLANALLQDGQLEAAIAEYETAIEYRPCYPEVFNNWGNALQRQGKWSESIEKYRKAIELHPSMPEAYSNLGAVLKEQRQFAAAIENFQQALALREEYPEVHNNLGNVYQEQGDLESAIACYRRALEINPSFVEIHNNLGNMLQQMDRYDEAFAHFERAIAIDPTFPSIYNNLGITYRNRGQIAESFAAYEQALALKPDFVEALWNKALTQLLVGEIDIGFAGYEWRLQWSKFREQNPPRPFQKPFWDGSSLQGKTIFVYSEQGMGDTIQFIRYIPLLAAQGARVIVECHPPLVNLLRQLPSIEQLIPAGSPAPTEFDVHAHLLSLPALCSTTLDTIPAEIPYLQAGSTPPLPPPAQPTDQKIGLVWSGNVQNPYNRYRAIALDQLLTLTDIPGIQFYCLQKELSEADAAILQAHPEVIDLRAELTDFVDTAALVNQLDSIISVDTSVTHLAGALGKPVHLLLPFAPDWRWMLERPDSPWYPTMQIYRQIEMSDWTAPLAALRAVLGGAPAKVSPGEIAKPKLAPPASSPLPILSKASPAPAAPPVPPIPPEIKLAVRQHQAGQVPQAIKTCRQLLDKNPNQFEAWHLLGVISHQQRNFDEAIAHYRKALSVNPNHHDTYNNLGVAFHEQGKMDDAIAHYEKVIALRPDSSDAHNNYANALQEKGKYQDAEKHYRRAIEINPDYADAYNNLGLALHARQEYAQAIPLYRSAVELKPNYPQAHNHLGNALKELGDFDEAVKHYAKAIELNPNNAKALNNWGNVFRDRGDLDTAIGYYDRATDLEPNFAEAHWNKALTLLLGGDLRRGFAEYEWRWQVKLPSFHAMRNFPQPLWDGTPLHGKTIFLHAEQGMGDVIQFIRYAKLVSDRGGKVIAECHKPLISLFKSLPHLQQLVPYGSAPPEFDLHAPLLSLPHILGITLETVPADVPYLPVPPAPHPPLPPSPLAAPFKLGLVWSGNPENPYNRTRAIPLAHLVELGALPGVQLYSFQKDITAADQAILDAHPEIIDLKAQLHDFVNTTALISQLDCIISVDTAVTHLTGAIAKPVWLLLPFAPDWRWLLERTDSPWYPTLRIFRQSAYGDWESVMTEVKAAISAQLQASPATPASQPQLLQSQKARPTKKQKSPPKSPAAAPREALPATASQVSSAVPPSFDTIFAHYSNHDLPTADRLCRDLLQQQPDHLEAMHLLGVILCQSGELEAAIAQFRKLLDQQPNCIEAWGNLGSALQRAGQPEEAIAAYQRAIALNPDFADAHHNLAIALQYQQRFAEALPHSQRAISLKPDFADAHYNLGYLRRRLGEVEAAIGHYQTALQLKPDLAEAHKNLGHVLLLSGNLPDGFREYEWRWQQPGWSLRDLPQPRWEGGSLRGKTILLYPEQGVGDTVQFIRYAPLLKQQGATVLFECPVVLERLLQTAPGIDRILPEGTTLPAFDVHAPLLSLPFLLKTDLATIPADIPYLRAEASAPPALTQALTAPPTAPPTETFTETFKIGIVWAGNPAHKNDRERSCALSDFQSLLQVPNTQIYSLQKGAAANDLQGFPAADRITDLSGALEDFADTAAAIAALDLVITVDTSVAHVAGALGKPVWVLLAFAPDWRWMLERTDSPWYPSLRLFRQSQIGDWPGVFTQVARDLQDTVTQRGLNPKFPKSSRKESLRKSNIMDKLDTIAQQISHLSTQISRLGSQFAEIQAEIESANLEDL